MATKKKPANTDQPQPDDPLADFPTDVEGGHWEYDETTGDRRWIADEDEAAPAPAEPPPPPPAKGKGSDD